MKKAFRLKVVRLLGILCLIAFSLNPYNLRAVVSDPWDNQLLIPGTHDITIYRGETYTFTPRFLLLSRPYAIPTNATVKLYWSTNNFASVWSTNGVLLADTGRVSVTWSPACDGGAGAYSYFIGIQEANGLLYRARGQITMRTSPGFNPSPASLPAWDGWFTNNYQYVSWLQMLAFSNSMSSTSSQSVQTVAAALIVETNRAQSAEAGLSSSLAAVTSTQSTVVASLTAVTSTQSINTAAISALTSTQAVNTASIGSMLSTGTAYAATMLTGSATNWLAWNGTNWSQYVVTANSNANVLVVSGAGSPVNGIYTNVGASVWANDSLGVSIFFSTYWNKWVFTPEATPPYWLAGANVRGAWSRVFAGVDPAPTVAYGPVTNTYMLATTSSVAGTVSAMLAPVVSTQTVNTAAIAALGSTQSTVVASISSMSSTQSTHTSQIAALATTQATVVATVYDATYGNTNCYNQAQIAKTNLQYVITTATGTLYSAIAPALFIQGWTSATGGVINPGVYTNFDMYMTLVTNWTPTITMSFGQIVNVYCAYPSNNVIITWPAGLTNQSVFSLTYTNTDQYQDFFTLMCRSTNIAGTAGTTNIFYKHGSAR